jgi:acetyltransferase
MAATCDVPVASGVASTQGDLERWQLADGTQVTVRALQASDRDLEIQFLESLSERSSYLRLMTPLRHASDSLVAQLMDVDGEHRFALVATVAVEGAERFIAVARYAQIDATSTAEVAVTVADAWQRRGIASRLVTRLRDHARKRGITTLVGEVLPDNGAMLALARKLGFSVSFAPGARLMHIVIALLHPT